MNSEEAFLFATFREFYKCWRSGTKARVTIESVNGKAFVNFSAFLGNPDDAHFKPRPSKWKPSKAAPRKKSDKKIKRDNDRAARFQESKRKEEGGAASALKPADNPEAPLTSSPGAESAMTVSDLEFTFASPVPENFRQESRDSSQCQSLLLSDIKDQRDLTANSINNIDNSNIVNHSIQEDININSADLSIKEDIININGNQHNNRTLYEELINKLQHSPYDVDAVNELIKRVQTDIAATVHDQSALNRSKDLLNALQHQYQQIVNHPLVANKCIVFNTDISK